MAALFASFAGWQGSVACIPMCRGSMCFAGSVAMRRPTPLAANVVEDTAFYRYVRLLARNEVGSDPARFVLSVQAFHQACAGRVAR